MDAASAVAVYGVRRHSPTTVINVLAMNGLSQRGAAPNVGVVSEDHLIGGADCRRVVAPLRGTPGFRWSEPDAGAMANYPHSMYDSVRKKLVAFFGNGMTLWEYTVPTRTWVKRTPSGAWPIDAALSGQAPEYPWALLSNGPMDGKSWYHQTAHAATGGVSKDLVLDPSSNTVAQATTFGGGPDKWASVAYDANAQKLFAWAYSGTGLPTVWLGTIVQN